MHSYYFIKYRSMLQAASMCLKWRFKHFVNDNISLCWSAFNMLVIVLEAHDPSVYPMIILYASSSSVISEVLLVSSMLRKLHAMPNGFLNLRLTCIPSNLASAAKLQQLYSCEKRCFRQCRDKTEISDLSGYSSF